MLDFVLAWFPGLIRFGEVVHISLLITLLAIFLAVMTTLHILKHKNNVSSSIMWISIAWLSPFLGVFLYFVLGVNRIQKKEKKYLPSEPIGPGHITSDLTGYTKHFQYVSHITATPMVSSNLVEVLETPAKAYDQMLEAIHQAKYSVTLSTYIFDRDQTGFLFVDALYQAKQRGVEVRVLIDGVGSKYSMPSTYRILKLKKIPCAKFMPSFWIWATPYVNLRNHRKIMVVDGTIGFVGGMNIRSLKRHPIDDTHFRVEGPGVFQLQDAFAHDWHYTTGEKLKGHPWYQKTPPNNGSVHLRSIMDGPDETFDTLRSVFCSAIMNAKKSIRIVNPYFLPDTTLIDLLRIAGNSGVQVQIILPEHNNLKIVQWATIRGLEPLLKSNIEVYFMQGTFDHSKLFTIDDELCWIGSANWDVRSLFLNFEIILECFDSHLNQSVQALIDQKLTKSKRFDLDAFNQRNFFAKYRSKIAYLFHPYL